MKFRNALVLSIILHIIVLGIFLKYKIPAGSPTSLKTSPLIARIIRPEPTQIIPGKREDKTPAEKKRELLVPEKMKENRSTTKPSEKRVIKKIEPEKKPEKKKEVIKPLPERIPEHLKEDGGEVAKETIRPPSPEAGPAKDKQEKTPSMEGSKEERKVSPFPPGRELLGRDLIAKALKKEAEKERKEKGSITFESKELKYYSYMLKLKRRIESIWTYPEEAARRGIFGDLYIEFTIRKDGTLGAVRLLRTSGYPDLDEAAMRALKDGQPYWPLPEHWGVDAITIKGHFIYTLYGVYVR